MEHIGSKCETQRVSRFSSQKYSSTAHAYVYVFITAKTKIAGPTRPHSVSSHLISRLLFIVRTQCLLIAGAPSDCFL